MSLHRVAVVVQARTSSRRLPGKVLAPLAGAPAIVRMMERVARIECATVRVVATSTDPSDDRLAEVCRTRNIGCVRGPLDDVLTRLLEAVPEDFGTVVRLTGDCPLIDPGIVDRCVEVFQNHQPWAEYVGNTVMRSQPDGLDVEVLPRALLAEAARRATTAWDREHVTPWVRRRARQVPVCQEVDLSALRWTLDTPDDYEVLSAIYEALYPANPTFRLDDVCRLLLSRPDLLRLGTGERPDQSERARWLALIEAHLSAGAAQQRAVEPPTARRPVAVAENGQLRSTALYERALTRIPGGTQLLSKRPERFLPGRWPAYYRHASGVEVVDLDGRTHIDVTLHAVGSCPLGYADPDVERAVIAAVRSGSMSTLNCPEEVELAELLCELHPWADMVRYARSGGEAMAVAVRIARAATGHETVAISGYHGWHDWYLAANLADPRGLDEHLLPGLQPAGVPRGLRGSVFPFSWGDPAVLDALSRRDGPPLAAIVMEPAHAAYPPDGYLEHARRVADSLGAVLVFDEITSGFRAHVGGVHQRLGVAPDVAVFAKAMSNGYPMAAVIGRRAVMDSAQRSFISSTYWSERIGPAAALTTVRKLRRERVPEHLVAMGERMRAGWGRLAEAHGLEVVLKGIPPLPTFRFEYGEDSATLATLYTKLMLEQGFLASGAFYACYAHRAHHVDAALAATDSAFAALRAALDAGRVGEALAGPVAETGVARRLA